MVENFFLFLGSLWGSWMVWVGGILRMIPFVEHLIEPWLRKKHPSVDAWFVARGEALKKNLKVIALTCLFIGCYRAWVFEHNNAQAVMYGKDGKSEAWSKYNECDRERFGKTILSDQLGTQVAALQTQIGAQQDTFNKCILAVGLRNSPQPLVATMRFTFFQNVGGTNQLGKKVQARLVIVRVNQLRQSAAGELRCHNPVHLVEAELATNASLLQISQASRQIDDRTIRVEIGGQVWGPDDDLVLLVTADNISNDNCTFKVLS